jgi:hypothetical protein
LPARLGPERKAFPVIVAIVENDVEHTTSEQRFDFAHVPGDETGDPQQVQVVERRPAKIRAGDTGGLCTGILIPVCRSNRPIPDAAPREPGSKYATGDIAIAHSRTSSGYSFSTGGRPPPSSVALHSPQRRPVPPSLACPLHAPSAMKIRIFHPQKTRRPVKKCPCGSKLCPTSQSGFPQSSTKGHFLFAFETIWLTDDERRAAVGNGPPGYCVSLGYKYPRQRWVCFAVLA